MNHFLDKNLLVRVGVVISGRLAFVSSVAVSVLEAISFVDEFF